MPHILVPNELIRPYLLDYLERYETGDRYQDIKDHNNYKDGYWSTDFSSTVKKGQSYSATDILSEASGIGQRRLWEIKHRDTSVRIQTADKLFMAMDMPQVWHTDPRLNEFYSLLGAEEEVESEEAGNLAA